MGIPLLYSVLRTGGTRKGGTSAHTGVKIESWRAIFSPWESPQKKDCIQYGCWLSSILFLQRVPTKRRQLDGCNTSILLHGSKNAHRVPSGVPIKDGYFDRVTVLVLFAIKRLIFGVFLTFQRIIKSYSAIYVPIRVVRRIFQQKEVLVSSTDYRQMIDFCVDIQYNYLRLRFQRGVPYVKI